MTWALRGGLLAIAAAAALAACAAGLDTKSGDDATRAGAAEMAVGVPVDDRVAAGEGDHTDWKTFTLAAGATLVLDAWWDDPGIAATVTVRDQFGAAKLTLPHRRGERRDRSEPFSLPEGQYFVQVEARDGASVYTLELTARGGAAPTGPVRPDF